jgi:hypothetical protein
VTLVVSQGTAFVDGQKPCSMCGAPRDRKNQRYCRKCHREYIRARRAGMVEVLLTPAEWQVIQALRAESQEPGA